MQFIKNVYCQPFSDSLVSPPSLSLVPLILVSSPPFSALALPATCCLLVDLYPFEEGSTQYIKSKRKLAPTLAGLVRLTPLAACISLKRGRGIKVRDVYSPAVLDSSELTSPTHRPSLWHMVLCSN